MAGDGDRHGGGGQSSGRRGELLSRSRKPEIVADAAHAILTRPARACTGNFFIDANVLREEGVEDLSSYAIDPSREAMLDFFLEAPVSKGVRKGDFLTGK